VKSGKIQQIHAVLFNRPDAKPTGWEPQFGPARDNHRIAVAGD
jgi:hypothetical protein